MSNAQPYGGGGKGSGFKNPLSHSCKTLSPIDFLFAIQFCNAPSSGNERARELLYKPSFVQGRLLAQYSDFPMEHTRFRSKLGRMKEKRQLPADAK